MSLGTLVVRKLIRHLDIEWDKARAEAAAEERKQIVSAIFELRRGARRSAYNSNREWGHREACDAIVDLIRARDPESVK